MQFLNWVLVLLQKLSHSRPLRGRLWGVFDTPLQPGTCDPSKYRCDPPTGYMQGFKKRICIRHRRWRMVERIQYAPTTGYVRSFKIPMRSPDWVRARVQKTVLFSSPFGAVYGAYSIRPYDRVRAILRNTDVISQPGTCGSSKNGSVFVPFGAVCGAYAIRPYNWLRATL